MDGHQARVDTSQRPEQPRSAYGPGGRQAANTHASVHVHNAMLCTGARTGLQTEQREHRLEP